ncbi:histone-lysine N-methyltransferase, H3 lysine-79 specific-like isoform X2 [Agrilus planipennis]|uniref:Histone-lysine N-methyltransferase, H3 lysine-79 specific-like isoform X2 n=1 Tax=Agrilus planipennis TaxID=224129 RepID=A0A1W4X7W9_AGRPL|nr:histone-lysine N-methyltransferase, H3 lysine-79 specific-like isoform X2 [Agrilus planipennis]
MSTFIHKPQSLVERKKQQWAREKEELSRLRTPWGKEIIQTRSRQLSRASSNSDLYPPNNELNRRPSLPPIHQSPTSSYEEHEKDFGGETSGYGSDNPNHTPEQRKWNEQYANPWGSQSDVKTFWETPDEISKIKDAPGWLKRGLQRNVELIVANSSPSESPEQDYKHDFDHDRPSTGSSGSQTRSFIRGQNIPLDPVEVAEREQKRQRALAHQEAIKLQLEEKERKKKEERERKLNEERMEEVRLEKEREIERERVEREQKALKEKQEKEQKRKEAMKQALELAQKQAEEMRKQKTRTNVILPECSAENPEKCQKPESKEEVEDSKIRKQLKEIDTSFEETEIKKVSQESSNKILDNSIDCAVNNRPGTSAKLIQTPNQHLILQPSLETINSMPFALLMSNGNGGTSLVPIAIPITTFGEEQSPKRTINRVLTPSSYRHRKFRNSSTQTDSSFLLDRRKCNKNRISAQKKRIFSNYESSRRGSRVGTSDSLNLSDRPKWGANRPHTRYLKQSEKDLLYQRRKSRTKRCQSRNYERKDNNYSPHSSDDSETASANVYSNNETIKKRTRALWQKQDNISGLNPLKTEIIPLETHNNQIYYKLPECEKCFCRCHNSNTTTTDILKIDHDTKNNNLNNNNQNLIVNNEITDRLTNTFQNQLHLKEETDSLCTLSVSLSHDNSKESSL